MKAKSLRVWSMSLGFVLVTMAYLGPVVAASERDSDVLVFGESFEDAGEADYLNVLFNTPRCIPSCTRQDLLSLTEAGAVENQIIAAIESAKHDLIFAQYTFSRRPIFEALLAAHKRGVRVRGIVDRGQFRQLADYCPYSGCSELPEPFSSTSYLSSDTEARQRVASVEALFRQASNAEKLEILFHGSEQGSSVRFLGGNRIMHHKFLVVDNALLMTGSGNWSSTAVSVNLENIVATSVPTTVSAYVCLAEALLGPSQQRSQATAVCQTESVFFTPVPAATNRTILQEIQQAVGNATRRIDIAMHHLVHPEILDDLLVAQTRGVQVRILTDDDLCIQRPSAALAALLRADAVIRYIPTRCELFQLAHNKFAVFDERTLITGSGNWSLAGLSRNFENFLVLSDDELVDAFSEAYSVMWSLGVEHRECRCDRRDAECRENYCLGTRR